MRKHFLLLIIVVIGTLFSSCAYYNTFYNAEQIFKAANERQLDITGRASRTAQQEYNEVIKKCNTLLEYYPNSKYVDDAIYLMALSYYKKGGSTTQVFEQCDKLIQYFPNSEFYTDAIILKALTLRDLRRHSEAYSLLEEQIISPRTRDDRAKSLLQIAEFHTEDEQFERARFYLNTILDEHKNTPEFKQATFFIALNYYAEKNYPEVINSMDAFLRIKSDRETRYEARYYIALSNYELKNYSTALRQVRKLVDDEYRREKKNKITILKGKILLESGQVDDGIETLNTLIAGNQRGAFSAETNYILGNYYLSHTDSLSLAIKHFNDVKRVDTNSEFVESAVAKSSVASQILLFRENNELEPQQLINEQFKLAEYYMDIMALPDSALVVYDNIIKQKPIFSARRDTIALKNDSLLIAVANLDSLTTAINTEVDSLRNLSMNTNTLEDSLAIPDSLKLVDEHGERMLVLQAELDTLLTELGELRRQSEATQTKLTNIEKLLVSYDEEFIPFAYFIKVYLYTNVLDEPELAQDILEHLQENFPDSKYTYTIERYLESGYLKLTTRAKEVSLASYEEATLYLNEDPDTTIVLLEAVVDTLEVEEAIKAKMALGYLYYAKDDTLSARNYFLDCITNYSLSEAQSSWVSTFFSDNKINQLKTLRFSIPGKDEEDEATEDESEATPDIKEEATEVVVEEEAEVEEDEAEDKEEVLDEDNAITNHKRQLGTDDIEVEELKDTDE